MKAPPAHPVTHAIALNKADVLRQALAQAPEGWGEEVVDGYTCWTRVLVDKKREHLLPILLEAGLNADKPVRFHGKLRRPFALSVKHGRHQAALRLLEAGASFNVWVRNPKLSALGAVVQQWKQACKDKDFPAPQREQLDLLLARMLTPDTIVLPEVMHGLMQVLVHVPRLSEPHKIMVKEAIEVAWNKGVRPDAGPIEREMRHVVTPLRLALKDGSPQVHRWLREALAFSPPTALWVQTPLNEVTHDFDLPNALQAIEIVANGWRITDRSWIEHEVNVWEAAWPITARHSSLIAPRLQVRMAMLKWGLANGLPVTSLVQGPRPLLATMLASSAVAALGAPEFFLEVFELAFRHGQDLSTKVGKEHNQAWRDSLAQHFSIAPLSSTTFSKTFWEKHLPLIEQLQARVRSEQLSSSWSRIDDLPGARPSSRF